jgi:hypothetical protein
MGDPLVKAAESTARKVAAKGVAGCAKLLTEVAESFGLDDAQRAEVERLFAADIHAERVLNLLAAERAARRNAIVRRTGRVLVALGSLYALASIVWLTVLLLGERVQAGQDPGKAALGARPPTSACEYIDGGSLGRGSHHVGSIALIDPRTGEIFEADDDDMAERQMHAYSLELAKPWQVAAYDRVVQFNRQPFLERVQFSFRGWPGLGKSPGLGDKEDRCEGADASR